MEFSSITIILLSFLAFSAIQARILPGNVQSPEDYNDRFMKKTIGGGPKLNPPPPPSLRNAPQEGIYKLSSSFLFSEEFIENLRQWFITIFNSGWLEPSFSAGNSCNKYENLTGVGRDPNPAPPSPRPPPGARWKLPSTITTAGVGMDPMPAPPSPRPPPGSLWKLPSTITTAGVGRDPMPAPPSPRPRPGPRWKLPSTITTAGVGRDPMPAPPSPRPPPGPRWKLPSTITTAGVGRDARPVPPSPRPPPGPRWKLPSFSGRSPWKTKIRSYFLM